MTLAERLAVATEPGRGIDAEMAREILGFAHTQFDVQQSAWIMCKSECMRGDQWCEIPRFTESVDEALELFREAMEGWKILHLLYDPENEICHVELNNFSLDHAKADRTDANLALASCTAVEKALGK